MLDTKLQTLLVVASEKNFTKAANKLNLTQPAVTNHISLLEEEYNVSLFIRGKKEAVLTKEGEILVNYAKRFIALDEQLKHELTHFNDNLIKINLGITHTAESNMITEILAKLTIHNPNINFKIITTTTENLYKMISNFELDLAIVDSLIENRNYQDLNYVKLDTDYLVCVLSNDNPLTKKELLSLTDLRQERMILRLPTSDTQKMFVANLSASNDSIENYNIVLEVDNIQTIKDLIRKNFGISILAKSACMDEVSKNKLTIRPIKDFSMVRQSYFIYHRYFNYENELNKIINLYTEEFKKVTI